MADNRTIEEKRIEWLKTAKENEDRDKRGLEFKCRAAARWLNTPEANWEQLKDLVYAIEAGRIEAVRTYKMTPAEVKSWNEYLMNR